MSAFLTLLSAAAVIGWAIAVYRAGERYGRRCERQDAEQELDVLRFFLAETQRELMRMEPVEHAQARARFEACLERRHG